MKKIMSTIAAVVLAGSVGAAEVGVSQVRDFGVNANGVRVETSAFGLKLAATNIQDQYNRFGVAKTVDLFSVGPLKVNGAVGAAYQSTLAASNVNGYGLTAGATVSYDLTKNVKAVVGVEQFYGQSRISGFSNTTGTIGLNLKF